MSEEKALAEFIAKRDVCDKAWDRLYADLEKGAKIPQERIASTMKSCNDAEYALWEFKLKNMERK